MYLNQLDIQTTHDYARDMLNNNRDRLTNFETAAQAICKVLYEDFTDDEGNPAFGLVRVFRLFERREMPDPLRPKVRHEVDHWLVLMGTYGLEADWCDTSKSRKHRMQPLDQDASAMVRAATEQLGIVPGDLSSSSVSPLTMDQSGQLVRTFYVPVAAGSKHITDQDEFVKPYGIKSVVGIGTTFASQKAYMMLIFSRMHIDEYKRDLIASMGPFVSTLLAIYDGRQAIWETT